MADVRFSRRDFVKMMGLGAASLFLPGCTSGIFQQTKASQARKKPNFVFMLVDDLGWKDLGCYGSKFYETPNIDKLAKEGMRFTDAYAACPVCSPTRASIMTGKYPARLKLTDWIPGRQSNSKHRSEMKIAPPEFEQQLDLHEVTIAEALKQAGYATCFVGKWHLGKQPYYPEKQGFDINIAGNDRGSPPSYFHPYKRGEDWSLDLHGRKPGEYLTDRLTDEALKFLKVNKDKPFLLYLSHYAVHIPLQAKKKMIEKFEAKASKLPANEPHFLPEGDTKARQVQDHPVYAAMIQSVDESVGRVMKKLNELDVADNTVVIFMSDNGGLSTAEGTPTSNVPLRAGKGWLYEGGIREPMIIKWPGVAKPGSLCSEPVTSTDFYPTMLDIAGLPFKTEQHIDGVSLVPLLKGNNTEGLYSNKSDLVRLDRPAIFWHYPHYSNQGGGPGGAVRAGNYKLIEFYEDDHLELYNLKEDIGETNDLAKKMPEKADELHKMLKAWRKDVNAQMPTQNPHYKPKEQK